MKTSAFRLLLTTGLLFTVFTGGLAPRAWAQSTTSGESPDTSRLAEQTRLQAEKAASLKPLGPNKAEQIVLRVERTGLLGTAPQGIYPWFGSVLGGGWLAVGAGYRTRIEGTGSVNFLGAWSLKNYKLLESNFDAPALARGRLRLSADVKWIDAPKVGFYGIGNDSSKDTKGSYLYRPTRAGGTVAFSLTRPFSVGGGADYLNVTTGPGKEGASIDEVFTPAEAPGLGQDLTFGVARAFAQYDWRTSPGYTRRGGFYRVDWATYRPTQSKPYGFERVDVDLRQWVPLMREQWVLAFHAAASMTSPDAGDEVAYFMMPYLGSGETLRGFGTRRFVDRNSLLLQAEYRWTPSKFVDMALFFDAGKVAPTRSGLDLNDMHTDGGIGIRFHGPSFTAFRIDLAKSREGLVFVFSTGLF